MTAAYAGAMNYSQQADMTKVIYRAIVKILLPDMNPGEERTAYQMNLLYKANDFYAVKNYSGLEKIYNEVMGVTARNTTTEARTVRAERASRTTTQATTKAATSLYEFFKSRGLEVIDKRSKGGALWVVGTPEQINNVVREACRIFRAGGNYAMNGGRATSYRTAWFTKCAR